MKKLHRTWILAIIFAVAVLFVWESDSVLLAKKPDKGGEKFESLHGCVEFRDNLGDLVPTDRIQGDGDIYCHIKRRIVTVVLESFWDFKYWNNSGRVVLLDYRGFPDTDMAAFTAAGVTPPSMPFEFSLVLRDTSLPEDGLPFWRAMPLDTVDKPQPQLLSGVINFEGVNNNDEYNIWFGRVLGSAADEAPVVPSPLTVRRIGTDIWTIESSGGQVLLSKTITPSLTLYAVGHMDFKLVYVGTAP